MPRQRGAQIVEFTMVLMPAMLLFSLILDGGLHMYYKTFLSHGASLIVRQMATDVRGTTTCPALLSTAQDRVEEYVSGVLDITGVQTSASIHYLQGAPGSTRGVCVLSLAVTKTDFGGSIFGVLHPRVTVESPIEDVCFDCNAAQCGGGT